MIAKLCVWLVALFLLFSLNKLLLKSYLVLFYEKGCAFFYVVLPDAVAHASALPTKTMCQALFPPTAGCCSSWWLTNRHITNNGCYCHWCTAPRHCLPLLTVPQSVMCHVIRVCTSCPWWVCRDPKGMCKGMGRGVVMWDWGGTSGCCPCKKNGPWSLLQCPQTSLDVPGPHAALVADRPKRRRVTAWLIATHAAAKQPSSRWPTAE